MIPLAVALLLISAFIASAETAFFHLGAADREHLHNESSRRAQRILELLAHPRDLLLTFLISNEASNKSLPYDGRSTPNQKLMPFCRKREK